MIKSVHAPLILPPGMMIDKLHFSPHDEHCYPSQIRSSSHCSRKSADGVATKLLDRDTSLHFSILRIQLIELIRNCPFQSDTDIEPALKFAREQLAPIAPKDPSYIEDLQNAMAIMLYSPDKLDKMPADVQSLLKPDLRENIARRANEAILKQQGYPMQPKLQGLVKLRAWAERRTKETTKGFLPKELALWEQSGIAPEEDSVMGGNGDG